MTDAAAESAHAEGVKRVLIVDDDAELRGLLQEFLIAEGYECVDAENAQEALEWLGQVKVDLAGVDLMMPHISGQDLILKMRQTAEWAAIPILLLSGYADLTRHRGLPVDDVQIKPFSLQAFGKKVRALIGSPKAGARPRRLSRSIKP